MGRSEATALSPSRDSFRTDLVRILEAALAAVDPAPLVRHALQEHSLFKSDDTVTVIAAGKAAWPMLQGASEVLGSRLRGGIGSGPRGRDGIPDSIGWYDGGHPLPGKASVAAGDAALRTAENARARGELVLVLLSGGASSLLCAPAEGISLADKAVTADRLMRCGRPIGDLNCVRRHLSRIKGGHLGITAGRSLTLAISDVHFPPDSASDVGSGPTVPDPTTYGHALATVDSCGEIPAQVRAHLERGAAGEIPETPKPGDVRLADSSWQVIANRHTVMRGAEGEARRLGYAVSVEESVTSGEARDAGKRFAERAICRSDGGALCVIGSGETTVTVRGRGRGGRNQEFVLGAAELLAGEKDVLFASFGTDGIDGPTSAAGGVVTGFSYLRARALGLPVDEVLARNDAHRLLAAMGDLIEWGPTGTNVGDLHILLTMTR